MVLDVLNFMKLVLFSLKNNLLAVIHSQVSLSLSFASAVTDFIMKQLMYNNGPNIEPCGTSEELRRLFDLISYEHFYKSMVQQLRSFCYNHHFP